MPTHISALTPQVASMPIREPIQTTLYDLIETSCDWVTPFNNGQMITIATRKILDSYRLTCAGDLKGYRFVCEAVPTS